MQILFITYQTFVTFIIFKVMIKLNAKRAFITIHFLWKTLCGAPYYQSARPYQE